VTWERADGAWTGVTKPVEEPISQSRIQVFTHTNDEGQFEMIVRYHIRAKGYVIVVNCFTAPQDEGRYMPLFDGTTGVIEPLAP